MPATNESQAPEAPRSERVDAWDMDVRVGADLGKYRLLAELGQGGMSNVFLAVARGPSGFHKLVVLKMLRPSLVSDPQFLAMFLDEARLAARLNHPNVVQTNEVGLEGDRHLIAMEYLEGQPLSRVLQRASATGGGPVALLLRALADACVGLHYAHELTDFDGSPLRLVHRDVSPQNVFVTYDGGVKVLDFGIAKAATSSTQTCAGVMKGKVAYMSPEQIAGELVDRRTDVYAMGVLLWEAAAGQRMWRRKGDVQIMQAVVAGQLVPPSAVRRLPVSDRLDAIVMKALARNPEGRYATALELQLELEALLEQMEERSSLRELGRYVGELFKEERARVKAIVERQLSAATRLPTGEYAALGYAPTLASAAGARAGSYPEVTPSANQAPRADLQRAALAAGPAPGVDPHRSPMAATIDRRDVFQSSASHGGVASTIRPPASEAPRARGVGVRWTLGVSFAAALFAAGGFFWARARFAPTAPPVAAGEVAPPPLDTTPPRIAEPGSSPHPGDPASPRVAEPGSPRVAEPGSGRLGEPASPRAVELAVPRTSELAPPPGGSPATSSASEPPRDPARSPRRAPVGMGRLPSGSAPPSAAPAPSSASPAPPRGRKFRTEL